MSDEDEPIPPDLEQAELEWMLIHTLIEANTQTLQTLEDYYYHRCHDQQNDLTPVVETLDTAIATHESIGENLETLHTVLTELDDSSPRSSN